MEDNNLEEQKEISIEPKPESSSEKGETETIETIEATEDKKDKKDKKIKKKKEKKEKPIKEKKKGSKKPLIILILIVIVVGVLALGYKFLPTIMKGTTKNYGINILVDYNKNLLFNKYDMDVSFNGTNIGTVKQGESITHSEELPNGTYVITFTATDDSTNTISSIIEISDETKNIGYNVSADWKGLTFKEDLNPNIPIEETSTEEEVTTDDSKEDVVEEETTVEEEPQQESTEE